MPNERQQAARIEAELRGVVETAVKDIGRGVLDGLASTTPRDTGFTAASWRASIGQPVEDVVGNRTSGGVAAAQAAQDASRSGIGSYALAAGPLFVASPLPSAGALDQGTSAQEPAGFVQRAIEGAVAKAERGVG